jgi:hypothetical protein
MNMICESEYSTQTETVNNTSATHLLNDKWILYHHFPTEKNWTLSGYSIICGNVDSGEKVISLNNALSDNIIKYSMLFFMRNDITPLWEDPANKSGGCFSYKVVNKYVVQVWRHMMFLAAGESLTTCDSYNQCINGITISPKKNFCIIKIWLRDNNNQDPNQITVIENLTKHGVMFKLHGEA